MTIDIRYTESVTPKQIIEKIKCIDDFDVEVIDDSAILSNKEDHPMILKMQKVTQAVTKKTAKLTKDHGSSDMRFMSTIGIPSVVFGPVGKNYHGKEEHVEVESLELFEKVLDAFIEEL
jgi:succinyl-diaminopimelate desuccinylase